MAELTEEQVSFAEDPNEEGFQENGMEGYAVEHVEGEGAGMVADMQNQSEHTDSYNELSGSDDAGKLFVGGLSWNIHEKELRDYFSAFGEVENINIKTDPNTGRSRGFAFILFKSPESVDKVIAEPHHSINNRKIDPKKAKARQGKIFVGGLTPELSDDEIKDFFAKFGSVAEIELPFDKVKNQRKGFCFVTYEQESVVTELLKTPKLNIRDNLQVDIKKAMPKPEQMMMRGGMRGGSRGMRGGGRGGRGRGGYGGGQSWNQGYSNYNQGYGGGYGGYAPYDYGGYSGYGSYGGYGGYDYSGYGGGYGENGYSGGKSQRGRQPSRTAPY